MEKQGSWQASRAMRDERGFLNEEEMARIMQAADHMIPRDRALIYTFAFTGRRVSEIVHKYGIRPADIDWSNSMINFRILKKKPRKKNKDTGDYDEPPRPPETKTKPLAEELGRILKDYIFADGVGYNDQIFPFTRFRAFQIVREVGKRAGIEYVGKKRIHPHHFRHSFAVSFARRIKDPTDLRKLQLELEHAHILTTTQYLTFSETESKKIINSLWK